MQKLLVFLTAPVLLAATTLSPQNEILSIPNPHGFEVGYQARDASQLIIEFVQPPETVDDWSQLITTQIFFGAARQTGLNSFYSEWISRLAKSCPNMTHTSVAGSLDGRPAIRGSLSCPQHPGTGKPENVETILIEGQANFLMVQIAFRHPVADDEKLFADLLLDLTKVCDDRDRAACAARKTEGFLREEI